jgi:hypothetical protein
MTYWVMRIHQGKIFASCDKRISRKARARPGSTVGGGTVGLTGRSALGVNLTEDGDVVIVDMDKWEYKATESPEVTEQRRQKPLGLYMRSGVAGTSLPTVGALTAGDEKIRYPAPEKRDFIVCFIVTTPKNPDCVLCCAGDVFVHSLVNEEKNWRRIGTEPLLQSRMEEMTNSAKSAREYLEHLADFLSKKCHFSRLMLGCGLSSDGKRTIAFWDSRDGTVEDRTEHGYLNMFGSRAPLEPMDSEDVENGGEQANLKEINYVHGESTPPFTAPRDGVHVII